MTSNYKKIGEIADGEYDVLFKSPKDNQGIPKTHIINNGEAVNTINNNNPSPSNPYSKTQKNVIYVHRTNLNGWAGEDLSKKIAVSTGCLLILGDQWDAYFKQINKTPYKLILKRK